MQKVHDSGDNRAASDRFVAVIPAYREASRIGPVVAAVRRAGLDTIVVDDGSPDDSAREAEAAGAVVLRHEKNQGKGIALQTGFQYAREKGYTAVVTLDADGQHDPAEIPKFVEAYNRTGIPVLIGNRMWNPQGMPWIRRMTNRFMSWLLSREMQQYVPDTQCGYRLYRSDVFPFVATRSAGFAAESEILLHIAERGIRIGAVRITTIYRDEKSKINPLHDTIRFFGMIRKYRKTRRSLAGRVE